MLQYNAQLRSHLATLYGSNYCNYRVVERKVVSRKWRRSCLQILPPENVTLLDPVLSRSVNTNREKEKNNKKKQKERNATIHTDIKENNGESKSAPTKGEKANNKARQKKREKRARTKLRYSFNRTSFIHSLTHAEREKKRKEIMSKSN